MSAATRAGLSPSEIRGHVRLFGKAPIPRPIAVDGLTAKLNPIRPLVSRDFLVGTNRGLADVFVYIKSGLEKWTFEAPTERVRFEHRGCQLYPRVVGAQTNQPLTIYNSDPIPHRLRSQSKNALNLPVAKTSPPRDLENYFTTVRHPEVFYRIQCETHSWENAYVAVVPHPFFAVSDANGSFAITNLPPGQYLVAAVHPQAGEVLSYVDLKGGQKVELDLEFPGVTSAAAVK